MSPSFFTHVGLAAAVSAMSLVFLQTDVCSRLVLSPKRLKAKRRLEYRYRWQQALQQAKFRLQYARAGGIDSYNEEEEILLTEFLESDEDWETLVDQIVSRRIRLRIYRIAKEGTEVFLWLFDGATTYKLPLAFVGKLAEAFDNQVLTSTFCFISDASAGVASELIQDLVHHSFPDSVAVIESPLWMVQLAILVEQTILSTQSTEQLVMSLCRLQALVSSKNHATIMFVIPTAIAPILQGWFQQVFPDDRHVFAYTGCIRTVEYALANRDSNNSSSRGVVPSSVEEALIWKSSVAYTTPLSKRLDTSPSVMEPFVDALAALPLAHADVVETWVTAVDAFLALKENEKINCYVPYVCHLEYLMIDNQLEANSDRYWSLRSLLQYVTGSRSRELTSEAMDAAISILADFRKQLSRVYIRNESARTKIENVVFQHKCILIENKTLLDTVQPAQHWTLKAAVKRGCACCSPEDDEEEEGSIGLFLPQTTKHAEFAPIGYVDGKSTFAFDPSRFS